MTPELLRVAAKEIGNAIKEGAREAADEIAKQKLGEVLADSFKGVSALVGPQGEKGDKGDKGDPGTNGLNGKDGRNGLQGPRGANGLNGLDGVMGPSGPKGDKGDPGEAGPVSLHWEGDWKLGKTYTENSVIRYGDALWIALDTVQGERPGSKAKSAWQQMIAPIPRRMAGYGVVQPQVTPAVSVNPQTGTSYTLTSDDNGRIVTLNNGSAITLTVPANLPAAFNCFIAQLGAGQVTIIGSGATVNSRGSLTHLNGQYAIGSIVGYANNAFILGGDLV